MTNIYHQAGVTSQKFEVESPICWGFGFYSAATMLQLFSKNIYMFMHILV